LISLKVKLTSLKKWGWFLGVNELKFMIFIGFIRLLFAIPTCKLLIINNIFKALL